MGQLKNHHIEHKPTVSAQWARETAVCLFNTKK